MAERTKYLILSSLWSYRLFLFLFFLLHEHDGKAMPFSVMSRPTIRKGYVGNFEVKNR